MLEKLKCLVKGKHLLVDDPTDEGADFIHEKRRCVRCGKTIGYTVKKDMIA